MSFEYFDDEPFNPDAWKQGLLTRDQFRNAVFKRDGNMCVFCLRDAQDAHHIMERKLWPDGGYYLDNGASVCGEHHLKCETTEIGVEEVRNACKITKIRLPPHLYEDQSYDKWGNPEMPNGQRLRGELFYDESVQKVIAPYLSLFVDYVKYPRTYHLPWSENMSDDDRMMQDLSTLEKLNVVVTTKMDGENTTLYSDYIHARSVDSQGHISRNWVKGFWARIMGDIPQGWRVCGENLYAEHSIHYDDLPSYFMGFSIWNERNVCLGWDESLEWFDLLGITPVPQVYRGPFDEKIIRSLWNPKEGAKVEGYVVRSDGEVPYGQFNKLVGKFVRKNHVQTVKHWMHGQPIVPNRLKY